MNDDAYAGSIPVPPISRPLSPSPLAGSEAAKFVPTYALESGGQSRRGSGDGIPGPPGPTGPTGPAGPPGPSGAVDYPFDITITDIAGTLYATFYPGTINQLLPSNMLSSFVVPASGTRYLVLDCTASNGEITSAALAVDTAPPDAFVPYAGQPPVAFKILIGLSVDGVAFKTWGSGSIMAIGGESFRLQKASPTAGQLPYDVYYTWVLSVA